MPIKKIAAYSKKGINPATKTEKGRKKGRVSTGAIDRIKAVEVKISYITKAYKFSEKSKLIKIHPRKILPKPPLGNRVGDPLPLGKEAAHVLVAQAAL